MALGVEPGHYSDIHPHVGQEAHGEPLGYADLFLGQPGGVGQRLSDILGV